MERGGKEKEQSRDWSFCRNLSPAAAPQGHCACPLPTLQPPSDTGEPEDKQKEQIAHFLMNQCKESPRREQNLTEEKHHL